mgnify:CR=1 FL=1
MTFWFRDGFRDPRKVHRLTTQWGVNYGVKWFPRAFWWAWWTPRWHEGRGPYVSIGCYVVAVYRGY